MAEEKEWKVREPSRLVTALEKARAKMRNEGLAKAKDYALRFYRSAIFLIREKHLGIDLSEINFGSLSDPNDGLTSVPVEEMG